VRFEVLIVVRWRLRVLLACLLLTTALPGRLLAHDPGQIIQETYVLVQGERIGIEYWSTLGDILASVKLLGADTDGDGNLSPSERDALLARHSAEIASNLDARVDGEAPDLLCTGGKLLAPQLSDLGDDASIILYFEVDRRPLESGEHVLQLTDNNFSRGELGDMAFYVRAGPHTRSLELSSNQRSLHWTFIISDAEAGGIPLGVSRSVMTHDHRDEPVPGQDDTLAGLVRRRELGAGFVLVALLLAAGFGALHALSPGHGKAVVAAYLVGARGRIRDAVFLGCVVTFTHVFSVILLGVVALVLTEYVAPEDIYPWLGFASGCLIFIVGYWLLARRALGGRDHHAHQHPSVVHHAGEGAPGSAAHGYDHEHGPRHVRESGVTFGSLLSLGISGGLVPCPSALVVLLAAIAVHRIAFGLTLIVAFSLGLAAVLILIGVLAVTTSKFLTRSAREGRWVELMPIISAGAIMVVGVVIAVTSLRSGGFLSLSF
jgi:ABC-type nickel/cobalt efflux system permease component RcnA